ncbi:TonB-dependent receptor [Rhodospirillum centenum]|uniref:TonB dependent receptor, putative n=1 Tax=Rhodospirillum centenum (strain ATCC 51521 / SW) TaxID=414684 RepID=B6IS01_RHOCS|nr:TonB-dependent receptor [Rhodospirillum centenum]ACI98237.1 TonB dependent receptor, putative [Rhodospirillum centenum SW]
MKNRSRRHTGAALAALALLFPPRPAPAEPSPLDEIVVTATRRPAALRDVPASVSTLDRAAFERQQTRFIGEELRGLPGVVLRTNDQGTYTDLVIRGVPNRVHNDTLVVMMDGVPFVTGDDEGDLEQLPFAAVGRVDLVRGPMSALYGRGAIAGTLNYITREVGTERLAETEAGFGSHGWRQVGALVQTPTLDRGALLLTGEVQRGDGWRDRTDRRQDSLFAKHRLDLAEWGRLSLTATWVDQAQRLAGELPVTADGALVPLPGGRKGNWNEDDAGFYKRMLTGTAILEAEAAPGLSLTTRLHARRSLTSALQGFFNRFEPGDTAVTFTGFRVDNTTRTAFAEQSFDWQHGPLRLLGGASAEQVDSRPVETWSGSFDFADLFYAQRRLILTGRPVDPEDWRSDILLNADARSRAYGAYLQGEWTLGPVTLAGGGRFDRFSRRVQYGPSGSGYGPDPVETVRDADQRVSPKASVTWAVGADLSVYAAYGAGFSPGFGPVWSFRGRDTALAPELADNIEAGIKGALLDGRLVATVTAYRLKRRDLLQLLPVNGTARTVNTGRQRSRGLEVEAQADLSDAVPGLGLDLAYGLTDAVWTENRYLEPDTGRPFDFSGKDVAGVPRHAGRVALTQAIAGLGLEARAWLDLSGDYPYDGANSVRSGGHALWNAALTWTPLPALDLTLTVRNLFDREVNLVVADNDGPYAAYPQPPREIFLSGKVRF